MKTSAPQKQGNSAGQRGKVVAELAMADATARFSRPARRASPRRAPWSCGESSGDGWRCDFNVGGSCIRVPVGVRVGPTSRQYGEGRPKYRGMCGGRGADWSASGAGIGAPTRGAPPCQRATYRQCRTRLDHTTGAAPRVRRTAGGG
jgi:hypothetical protein